MIQPLNGNIKVNRFGENRLILVLLLVILLLLTVILDDKFEKPKYVEFYNGLKIQIVKTYENDVDSFLRSQNISLSKCDILLNSLSEPLTDNLKIRLIKVTEDVLTEEEPVPFKQVANYSSAIAPDSVYELRAGRSGLRKNYYKITYHNGVQKSRQFLGEVNIKKPLERIILCGKNSFYSAADKSSDSRLAFNVSVVEPDARFAKELGSSCAIMGIAIIPHDILKENTVITVEGYGNFVVKNEDAPSSGVTPAQNTSQYSSLNNMKLVVPRELAKKYSARKRNVKVCLI